VRSGIVSWEKMVEPSMSLNYHIVERSIEMESRPSLQQVARGAGVAKSTASLAMKNDSRISAVVRERVQAVAQEIGYKPHLEMAKLMSDFCAARRRKFSGTLALVNCSHDRDIIKQNSVANTIFDSAKERAEQLGYSLDTFWLRNPEVNATSLSRIFYARNILGVIFHNLETNEDIAEFDPNGELWKRFPCVITGRKIESPPLPFAVNDIYTTVYQLGIRMKDIGYRRTGFLLSKHLSDMVENRCVAGFFASQSQGWSSPASFKSSILTGLTKDSQAAVVKWLKRYQPDSIICLSRYVYDWIISAGIRIPESMGMAFMDLSDDTKGMAGMMQNHRGISKAAVEALIGRILSKEENPPPFQYGIIMESSWRMGKTVRISSSDPKP